MKNIIYVLIITLCTITTFSSCSSNTYEESATTELATLENDSTPALKLKTDIDALNATYTKSQTRVPKWLRWLIATIIDVGAFLVDGQVGGAASASKSIYDITKSEAVATLEINDFNGADHYGSVDEDTLSISIQNDLKDCAFENVDVSSVGYMHNAIIANLYEIYDDSLSMMSNEDIFKATLKVAENTEGTLYTQDQISSIREKNEELLSFHKSCNTISEYVDSIKTLTNDSCIKQALDICGSVTEGLQYVDDNDTTYINKVQKMIDCSHLDVKTERLVKDGVSIAYASAKLWNTERKNNQKGE